MSGAHSLASGMGGIRTAGDLVARMEIARGMKINEAKEYVAKKLEVSVADLSDPVVMNELRRDLDIGSAYVLPGVAQGIDAKFRIAELLDIEINSVKKFEERIGRKLK